MTTRPPVPSQAKPPARAERKARLETAIEQQRVDILVATNRWHEASRPIDDAWRVVARFKVPLYVLGGALLLKSARRPGALLRMTKRLGTGALLLRRIRRLLR